MGGLTGYLSVVIVVRRGKGELTRDLESRWEIDTKTARRETR